MSETIPPAEAVQPVTTPTPVPTRQQNGKTDDGEKRQQVTIQLGDLLGEAAKIRESREVAVLQRVVSIDARLAEMNNILRALLAELSSQPGPGKP